MQWLPPTAWRRRRCRRRYRSRGRRMSAAALEGRRDRRRLLNSRAALAPLLSPSSTCRTSRQNESPGFNRGFQGRPMRFDLGVDGPRRSEANLIRPSREALKRRSTREIKPCVGWKRITSSSNARRLLAHRASGDDGDYDVLRLGEVVGRIFKAECSAGWLALDVDLSFRGRRGSNANARLCRNARGANGGIR